MQKWSREVGWCGEAAVAVKWMVPHSHVVDKNQEKYHGREGYYGSEQSQPQARLHSPGFQHQKDKSSLPLAEETTGSRGGGRNCQIFTT